MAEASTLENMPKWKVKSMTSNLIATTMGTIKVIQAVSSDVEDVLSLLLEAAQWIESKGIDQWRVRDFTEEMVQEYFNGREIYLALFNGKPIGTFALQWSDESIWKELDNQESGYLHRLAVSRIYSGKGIGNALLNWAEQYIASKGKRYFRLDCMADNVGLNQFYQSAGFMFKVRIDHQTWSAHLYEKEL